MGLGSFWTLLNVFFVVWGGWPFTTELVDDWRAIFENDINELDVDGGQSLHSKHLPAPDVCAIQTAKSAKRSL